MAWRRVLFRSMKTTSVRGTITSRTIVSPSSKTEWIIARSPDSMTWLASARSTSSRSSASDENGPSLNPRPGVIRLPTTMSSWGSGPRTRVNSTMRPADEQRHALGVDAGRPCAGADADDHELDHQHHRDRDQHADPGVGEVAEQHLGDQDDRGDLAEHPQEQRGVEEARGSSAIISSRAGAAAALGDELLGPDPGDRGQRGVGAGEEAGHDHQDRRDDAAGARSRAGHAPHRPRSVPRPLGRAAGPGGRTSRRAPRARRGRSPSRCRIPWTVSRSTSSVAV